VTRNSHRIAGVALLALSLVIACSSGGDNKPDSAAAAPVVAAPASPRPGETDCPLDGLWKHCALLDRMVRSGLAPKATGDTMRVPFFSVPGVRFSVGRTAMLTAFYYPDSLAAIREAAKIDTLTVRTPGDTVGPWTGTPNFIRSGNLIAILESESPRQVERMRLAITAGAP
jgi:hypothetical protein